MRIAYVSGPYRAKDIEGVQDNIYYARKVSIELWKMGFAVICPHTNTANFPDGAGEFKDGTIEYIKGDLEFLKRFHSGKDVIVMIPGWIDSDGARKELSHAINLGISAYHWPRDKQKLRELNE